MPAKIEWSNIQHFSPHEFKEPDKLSVRLIYMLDHCRDMAQVPMTITGSHRKPGKKRDSGHKPNAQGKYEAVDVRVTNPKARFRIMAAAIEAGFHRIGVYNRHIHLDIATKGFTQNVMWWGKSK